MVWLVWLVVARVELYSGALGGAEPFTFSNETMASVFLLERAFPAGSSLWDSRTETELAGMSAFHADGANIRISVPLGSNLMYHRWQVPKDLCPAPAFLLFAEYKLIATAKFRSDTPVCFFVDPRSIGHMASVTVTARNPGTEIQYFVSKTDAPDLECQSWMVSESVNCFVPYAKPFFVRVGHIEEQDVELKIEYSAIYDSSAERVPTGCGIEKIPSNMGGSELELNAVNVCMSLRMQTIVVAVKCAVVLCVLVLIGASAHLMGYGNFKHWLTLSSEVPLKNIREGCTTAACSEAQPTKFSLASSSFSSDLSEDIHRI